MGALQRKQMNIKENILKCDRWVNRRQKGSTCIKKKKKEKLVVQNSWEK